MVSSGRPSVDDWAAVAGLLAATRVRNRRFDGHKGYDEHVQEMLDVLRARTLSAGLAIQVPTVQLAMWVTTCTALDAIAAAPVDGYTKLALSSGPMAVAAALLEIAPTEALEAEMARRPRHDA